jgi:hypothetical protein
MQSNFTSRVAGWSTAHRKGVRRGWLAFVLVAFALGGAAGMVKALEEENGQSRLADQTQAQQFPTQLAQLATKGRAPHRAQTRASPIIRLTTHHPTPHQPGPRPRPGSDSAHHHRAAGANRLDATSERIWEACADRTSWRAVARGLGARPHA